ncbi:MAG: gliding motility-associated C-terminal domain-containing protein [Labilibaculum sp.]|nr:gliding motility-associated C-terminal domain-containing protein [Labilibaculum sp.]MBI9059860.1 gliding motility-associated C-terminal domain-containing protein [Labilibaculum sp.]
MSRKKNIFEFIRKQLSLSFMLLSVAFSSYSQQDTVRIDSDYQIMYCSANNGEILPMQEIQLLLEGPKDKKWFVSFSVNNSPAIILNGRMGIDFANFNMSLFFRNTSDRIKNYHIELKKAWLEDLTPMFIPEEYKSATIQVMPLAKPEVDDYYPKAKISSTQNYSAKIGKNSTYDIWVPDGARLIEHNSEVKDNKQELEVKIKWPKNETNNYFRLIETDAFGCNSDTIFAGMEVVKSFTVDLGGSKSICEGDSVVLSPSIDLPSKYSYLWSTGEQTKDITVSKNGNYHVSVTDLTDNQEIKADIDILVYEKPSIKIEDRIIIDDNNPLFTLTDEASSYLWSNGSTDSEIKITESGSYSIRVESSHGCANSKSFYAKMESDLFNIHLPELIHMCGNEKLNLEPNLSINQAYQFEWSNGSTDSLINIDEAGEYWVKITDPDGFQKTGETEVNYHPNPIIDLGSDRVLWDQDSILLDAGNEGSDFIWNTGETSQKITAKSGGVFMVEVSDQYACSNKDTLYIDHRKGEKFGVFLGDDQIICSGDSVYVSPQLEGNPSLPLEYKWLGLNKNTPEVYLKNKGHYCLEIIDANGNVESDCIEITMLSTPEINLGQDLVSYPNQKIQLDAGTPNCFYKWSTGEITQKITLSTEGRFWVEVTTDQNCTSSDTIDIGFIENYPFVGLPKAFTPNGDGHNDKLFIRGGDVKEASLVIYNRLGHKLFETSNINTGWDGFFKGQLQDIDVYVYVLEVTFLDGKHVVKKGNVALLR